MTIIKRRYAEAYQNIGMSIEDAIKAAVQNLGKLEAKKTYTIQHDCNRENCIDVPMTVLGTERYLKDGIDESDILNFALQMYLPVAKQDQFKWILKEKLTDEVFLNMLEQLGMQIEDQEVDEEKNRVYAYTNCPDCGARRFYFSFDKEKKNIYAGCYDSGCDMHKAMDIIAFVQKYERLGYKDAVEYLYTILLNVLNESETIEPSINENMQLKYCEIKEEADYCIVVTDKTDLLAVCQYMQSESIILIEPHQLSRLEDIITDKVTADQLLVLLCDSIEIDQYEQGIRQIGMGDQQVIVYDLPEARHKSRLLGLTAIKLLADELGIR